jgi:1,4-alpha-glucan branching enzyme
MSKNVIQPDEDLIRVMESRHHDPFCVLGKHRDGAQTRVRALLPCARDVVLADIDTPMQRLGDTDIFTWQGHQNLPEHYRISWVDDNGKRHTRHDPYSMPPQIPDYDLHLFGEGRHWHAYRVLGSHTHSVGEIHGVLFAVWAPNAVRVSVVGEFNDWDGRRHPMRVRGYSGVWELFVPDIGTDELYKYEILSRNGDLLLKTDPYAQYMENRPGTASRTWHSSYQWDDSVWLDRRAHLDWQHSPMSVYELHLGSWRRSIDNQFLNYRQLAEELVSYIDTMGYTHIELLPITEHPLDASWGYQTTGYFAPTSRFGDPDDFRYLVDLCHQHDIGVLLDWVPAHFPKDAHGLAWFDGSPLYEHEDPKRGEHRDWGTLIYNYGRNEVKNLLMSSAMYWVEEFHIDGLRVDAVASMLYLDYSREEDDWLPNIHGGNENLEAIDFLRELNSMVQGEHPGSLMIAEESTSWPQVSRPSWLGGLGFSMKWNMGWMHDTLQYMSKEPVHRHYHHDQLTFGLLYAFTENFVLPFSHDEVVHGKSPMIYKMPGDEWQRFANLRLLYTYMYCYPGHKLLFMGNDIAQGHEWDHDSQVEWHLTDYPLHAGMQKLVGDLNHLYRNTAALHRHDFEAEGFEWVDCHDASQSVLSFMRKGNGETLIVILNFTPIPRQGYRIGVPGGGNYRVIFNSDSTYYGGSNYEAALVTASEPVPWMNLPDSLVIDLPPLAGIVLKTE